MGLGYLAFSYLKVSINSTSEEVRRMTVILVSYGITAVSINSTSEEVRSENVINVKARLLLIVSINSTSEEVRSHLTSKQT